MTENTPLLHPKTSFSIEISSTIKATLPLAASFFLQYLLPVTNIYWCGKLGETELASATLASSFFTITGLGIYQGLATCLDSMCSQAFGAGRITDVGIYWQKCCTIGIVITIFPLIPLWLNAKYVLSHIVSDSEVLEMTQKYLGVLTLGAPGLLLFETGKRFLQGQQIFQPQSYILVIVTGVNLVMCWLFIGTVGFIGAPICMVIAYWLQPLLMLGYVTFIDGKKCWPGAKLTACFNDWKPMLLLAVPGIIMTEAEYLACQVINILASNLGTDHLAAQSITSNVGFLSFQLSLSLGVALGTKMGYFVGDKEVFGCKTIVRVCFVLGIAMSIFNSGFIMINRTRLARLFTDSEDVIAISNTTLTLSAINQISDVINVVTLGVLRGQGRQKLASILTVCSYYLISFPVGYYFGFKCEMGLPGYWYGYISGVIVLAVVELGLVLGSNWNEIFTMAEKRVRL